MSKRVDQKDAMLRQTMAMLGILLLTLMLAGCGVTLLRVPVSTPLGEADIEVNGSVRLPWLADAWQWAYSNWWAATAPRDGLAIDTPPGADLPAPVNDWQNDPPPGCAGH